jgi:hypothetical protein
MFRSIQARALSVMALSAAVAGAVPAFAQAAIEVPAPSLHAKVEQRVGITDFSVDYSSPAMRGRKIFGGLLPYDQLWRTGANASTKLTASRDFTFGDKAVPKGTYSVFSIPGAASWTVILNKNADASAQEYDEKQDAARVKVTPQTVAARERMTFIFSDTTENTSRLDLEWDTVRVSVPIKVDTQAQVMAGIDATLADAWRPYYTAGRYLVENGGSVDTAIDYLDKSIGIKSVWWNNWWRAQALAKKGKAADAIAAGEKTLELGKGNETFENFFKADVQKTVDGWKKGKS